MKKKIKYKHILLLLLILMAFSVIQDAIRNSKFESYPERPDPIITLQQDELYYELANDSSRIDWGKLSGTLEYIRGEYDCSDFRLVNLVRILYEYGDRIPEESLQEIEEVLFNFRFWWDDPGENSMCYWSENHQILFASAEYLIGQLYPDVRFRNSGLTGRQHMDKARIRALDWLKMRWDYGFIEYYSSVYYKEDIGALINLIDFAGDEELVIKSQIIMDLLFYDVASQSSGTMFSSVSGRAYQRNRMGREAAEFSGLTNYLWGDGREIGPHMMYGLMHSTNYKLPPVLKEIALDSTTVIIKQSNGLDLSELKGEGYFGSDNRSMMMQWGMESFTNPEIVRNSLAHIRNCNMFTNHSLRDFKTLNYRLLSWFHLEPGLIRIINPQSNGVSIQKGNTYTYRTPDYSMYTVQDHQVGDYGDQQHVFGVNIRKAFSIFHNHPALEKEVDRQSPNYWVGYGHFPHSAQDRNVNLSIYNIPRKKGMMEADLLDYTRAYFPSADFDSAFIDGSYVFGKLGDTYCAFIGAIDFHWRDDKKDDVIQDGKQTFWITEVSSKSEEKSFAGFISRIQNNPVNFDPETLELRYESGSQIYELEYNNSFKVNGQRFHTDYPRYDSPYVKGEKKDRTFTFTLNGKSLYLDFDNMIREF